MFEPVTIPELWLPILVAGVAVFIVSTIMWMVLPHHKKDIRFLPDEDAFTGAVAPLGLEPGLYMFPGCDPKDMRSEAFQARWKSGPWGTLVLRPGQPSFGMNMLKTFVTCLVITVFVAYVTGRGQPAGSGFGEVFQLAGPAAILAYCLGGLVNDFFLGKPTRFIVTGVLDGLVYALVTAAILAWMWPGDAMPALN